MASDLARVFLALDMTEKERCSAKTALTVMLDDPSLLVRQALAEAFAECAEAPHHIILSLAMDRSEVSAPVLARSPLLSDEELIDCASIGDAVAQTAIAMRAALSPNVAATLAEIGAREALIALAANAGADLPPFALQRIFDRFGEDAEAREALLHNPRLPVVLRLAIARRTAAALTDFVGACAWMPSRRVDRVACEAIERATVAIAAGEGEHGARTLTMHLRASGQLTVALILRSLLSGERTLFEAALCELSGLPPERVSGLLRNWPSAGFAALYDKAGLPRALLPAFRAALGAQDELAREVSLSQSEDAARLSTRLVARVLSACEDLGDRELGSVIALLRRLACEAAREDAREASIDWRPAQKSLPPPLVRIDLVALEADLMAA